MMLWDEKAFALINSLAGHDPWLDAGGRFLAVFGVLLALGAAAGVAWWPGWRPHQRAQYLYGLLSSLLLIAVLMGAQWYVEQHVFNPPHPIRYRPMRDVWATVLISAGNTLSFPAWSAAIALALAMPTWHLSRWASVALMLHGLLIGLALVFTGANYPLDVLAGLFVGATVGITAAYTWRNVETPTPWVTHATVPLLWVVLLGGCVEYVVLFRDSLFFREAARSSPAPIASAAPALAGASATIMSLLNTESASAGVMVPQLPPPMATMVPYTRQSSTFRVEPPSEMLARLGEVAHPGIATVEAASNGRLVVAVVRVKAPDNAMPLDAVETLARASVNAAFGSWAQLGYLTILVTAEYPNPANDAKTSTGTLYSATVTREQWPAGGFPPGGKLPGKKYFAPRFVAHASPAGPAGTR